MGALTGVRVLDFSWALAGPVATMMLTGLGAEVIKVESRTRLDVTRHGPSFHPVNRGKMGITLNMRDPRAAELAKEIAKQSDVVMENFRPGVMEEFGLGYDTLRALKPDIVMLSCSIAGGKGPHARFSGYAPLFVALSGLGELTGYPDGPPTEVRIASDVIVGVTNAVALLGALMHRQQTGMGQHVDVSAVEALSAMAGDSILDYVMNGRVQRRAANDDTSMAPHNCYRCQGEDGWVSIVTRTDGEWRALCEAMGNPVWTREPRFRHGLARWRNREELDRLIERWTATKTSQEVMSLLQPKGVAAAPSYRAPELFGNPHVSKRGVLDTLKDGAGKRVDLVRLGGRLSETPFTAERIGPGLGEHNQHILGGLLGRSDDEIAQLREQGVVA